MILNFLKTLWLSLAVLVILVTLYFYDGKEYSDIWIVLTWCMIILSFPSGLIISLIHSFIGAIFQLSIQTTVFSLLLEWAAYCLLGYYQWFVLLPSLWSKWKIKKKTIK